MDNFTGLNIERAYTDIMNFNDECFNVWGSMGECFNELFISLYEQWASPIAKDFTTKKIAEYEALNNDFRTEFTHIVSGAASAATTLAKSNGVTDLPFTEFICEEGYVCNYSVSENNGVYPCEEVKNGATGMDTANVTITLSNFNTKARSILNQFDGLPNGIAFYDPAGQLVDSYNRNVNSFKDRFTALIESTSIEITNYTETETDNILIAKQKAQDILSAKM